MSDKIINNLVIVESPAKARTIAGYLGKDFTVMSSIGHIRSIPTDKELGKGQKAIDTSHDFATIYTVDSEKKKTVAQLAAAAKKAKTVWLATDEDREGEAIAWHLCEALKLDPAKTNRIAFHEITKTAIDEAIKNPRKIDMDLVKAQQARQILDRLVGFELSPVVWRKVPGGKSAGRVQSPAVKLLVEREREITEFEGSSTFKVSGEFTKTTLSNNVEQNPKKLPVTKRQTVAGFIISNDNKMLFGHKKDARIYSGLWLVPGGGIEEGEDEIAALKREMMEESGIDISLAQIRKVYTTQATAEKILRNGEATWCEMTFNNYEIKIDLPAADIKTEASDDLVDLQWFSADEIIEKEQLSATLETLDKIGFLKSASDETIKANLSTDFPDENSAKEFLESLIGAKFAVADIETNAATRKPLPPFTTSTLQQDANARLGMSARTTMSLAQQLYQSGMITYMRTDSPNLSNQFLGAAGRYIEKNFGKDYLKIRKFKAKSAGAQEAHEAIRPTDPDRETAGDDPRAQKLYDLVRRRTLASQMADAKIERTTATIEIASAGSRSSQPVFTAKGEVVLFDGFLKMYGTNKEEILPSLATGDELSAKEIIARQTFARPPMRYTEGSLVKKLEELGIGRPSTYATIIGTIQTRGYAEKGDSDGTEREAIELILPKSTLSFARIIRNVVTEKTGATKGKLLPSASGTVLSDFLGDHFTDIVDYGFTARIETELDEIAESKLDKIKMLHDFYGPFHKLIDGARTIDRSAVAGARHLGIDPKTGKTILARIGRFGPMLQMGETDDKSEKPRFANFPADARLETITLDQALTMFRLPRSVGTTDDGQEIVANIGRFGPYVKVGSTFVSIKDHDPFTITEVEARDLIAAKLAADQAKNIADFGGGLKILNGRYGPYITDGKKNVRVPKDTNPSKITADQAKEMLTSAPDKPKRGRFVRKKK